MSTATVELEHQGTYSNLDVIRGKVNITLTSETAVKSIVVKMEGVSKTVVPIIDERNGNNSRESKRDAIEIHKFLYKTLTVFPPSEVAQNSTSNQFTLPAGDYTYDFHFKIPLKGYCTKSGGGHNGLVGQLVFNAGGLDYARKAGGHVESMLPPSLSGFGDNATIKYFIKATVNKASMFRINTRATRPFVLLPMDVPLIDERKLAFVRREITLGIDKPQQSNKKGKSKLFGGFFNSASEMMGVNSYSGKTMSVSFEARFPKTGAFQPVTPLPIGLFLLLSNPTGDLKSINLSELTVTLYAVTETKAQQQSKFNEVSLNLCHQSNLNHAILFNTATESQARTSSGGAMYQIEISPEILSKVEIPDFVPPTFTICNINRKYTLEIHAGFQINPELPPEFVSLSIDCVVQSGIPIPQNDGGAPAMPPLASNVHNAGGEKTHMDDTNGYSNQGPQITSEGQELSSSDMLPTYDDAMGSSSSSSQAAPSGGGSVGNSSSAPRLPRRKFAQSDDYYKNLDGYE